MGSSLTFLHAYGEQHVPNHHLVTQLRTCPDLVRLGFGIESRDFFLSECTKRSQRNDDFNGVQREGCGEYQFLIRDGVRDSSAVAFLSPFRRHYAGKLEIRPFSHVTKIIFEVQCYWCRVREFNAAALDELLTRTSHGIFKSRDRTLCWSCTLAQHFTPVSTEQHEHRSWSHRWGVHHYAIRSES